MADQARRSNRLPIIAGAVVVLIVVAVGGFFYLTRDKSDPKLKLTDSAQPSGGGSTVARPIDVASLDGSWTVAPGTGDEATVAGYRVQEEFAAGARKTTANGRTSDVTGTFTLADGTVAEGSFSVDLTTLTSDEGRRDSVIKTRGLESDKFPEATFALTEPIVLPTDLQVGVTSTVSATGDFTLHGVTKPVTMDLTVKTSGDTVTINGSAPIVMADYDIEPPSVGGFVTVSPDGSFEFIVNFVKG